MAKSKNDSKGKPEQKESIMTKLASELEVPSEVLPGVFHMELLENREAVIDGCKGVQEYNDERIILKLNKKTVTFLGLNLELKAFKNERVIISGYIANIGFSD